MKNLIGLLVLISIQANASIDSFYSVSTLEQISNTTLIDAPLKDLIHTTEMNGQLANTYKEARWHLYTDVYLETDIKGNSFIKEVYCEKVITNNVSNSSLPYGSKTNIEHTWPQSKFNPDFSKELQKADLHHLFITNSKANHLRGSQHFGEVTDLFNKPGRCNSAGLGILVKTPADVAWSSNNYYQPPVLHRGNVARALFYFATRYQMKINDTQEYFLKKWHKEDPVTEIDILRNDRIENIQGNRNPFIDFPNLVDRIKNF